MNLPDAPIATRRFLRNSLLHRERPGQIEGLLCLNSWRESDQARQSRYIKLANAWIILNSGGGPTPDKPEVLLETPSEHVDENPLEVSIFR